MAKGVGGLAAKIFGKSQVIIAPALKGAMGAVKGLNFSRIQAHPWSPGRSNCIFAVW